MPEPPTVSLIFSYIWQFIQAWWWLILPWILAGQIPRSRKFSEKPFWYFWKFWRVENWFENEKTAKYYAHYFLTSIFNEEVLKTVSGQQLPRTSWTDMQELKIPVPPLEIQEKLVSEIEILETQIITKELVIKKSADEKQAILKKYL
jgi:restriction endonuclease S subunit